MSHPDFQGFREGLGLLADDESGSRWVGIGCGFFQFPHSVWKSEAACRNGRCFLVLAEDIKETCGFFPVPFSLPNKIDVDGGGASDKSRCRGKRERFERTDVVGLDVRECELYRTCVRGAAICCVHKRFKKNQSAISLSAGGAGGASGGSAGFGAGEDELVTIGKRQRIAKGHCICGLASDRYARRI